MSIWNSLQDELAADQPWGVLDLPAEMVAQGSLEMLPASIFLVGLRNATAHGDDRKVNPLHIDKGGRADRRLVGFIFDAKFDEKHWGCCRLSLTKMDMPRVGLALAERFCDQLDGDARREAERHVLVA